MINTTPSPRMHDLVPSFLVCYLLISPKIVSSMVEPLNLINEIGVKVTLECLTSQLLVNFCVFFSVLECYDAMSSANT